MNLFTRRTLVKTAFAFSALASLPNFARAALSEPSRTLHFHNTHTGESLKTVYWENGSYQPEALKDIDYILRDHRTGDMLPMDPQLLDVLAVIHSTLHSRRPFEVISGYRTPRSNALLSQHSHEVDKKSLHMVGQAIDVRLTDRPLSSVRNVAWDLQQGGVGYYRADNFVHIDTGHIRRW